MTTQIPERLISLLDLPDTDYWSDVACDEARTIIDSMPDIIFPQLLKEWKSWPAARQENLAYILGEGSSPIEKELVEQMVNAESPDVAYNAREAMRNLK